MLERRAHKVLIACLTLASLQSFAMTTLFAWFLALCLAHGAIADENIPEALDADDQCTLPGCAVNALQLHVRGPVEPVGLLSLNATEEELMEWHQDYYGHKPRADISVANYKSLMQNISVQQKAILALWNRSVKLEEEVHALVQQVQHDSGLKVADYIALVEDADMPSREQAQENQPREAHVKKWIRYLPDVQLFSIVPITIWDVDPIFIRGVQPPTS